MEFVLFAGEAVAAFIAGGAIESTNFDGFVNVGFDGTTAEEGGVWTRQTVKDAFGAGTYKSGLAEGYHYANVLGKADGTNTLTVSGGATVGNRTSLSVMVGQ